jgi:membrane-associated protease RseP (regulator of RpoE activity)
MLGIILFIAAILISIMLHEFGHFATARAFGMKVEEFFVGFGPKLWSFRRGDTEYGAKAIPLGGYVRIAGMNPFEDPKPEDEGRTYKSKRHWQRAIVLTAGSFMHFVIAVVILIGIFAFAGVRGEPTTVLREVVEGTPAAAADMRSGDRLVEIAGQPIRGWTDVQRIVSARPDEQIEIVVERDGELLRLEATPATDQRDGQQIGYLGIGPDFEKIKRSLPAATVESIQEVGRGAKASLEAFINLFSPDSLGRLFSVASGRSERSVEDPATLIGVGGQAGNFANTGNWLAFFSLIAAFNIFIGVANLVPLPPLDGGHLAVVVYEKIRGKEADMRKLVPVSLTVIMILGSMFMLLLYLDIVSPLPDLAR